MSRIPNHNFMLAQRVRRLRWRHGLYAFPLGCFAVACSMSAQDDAETGVSQQSLVSAETGFVATKNIKTAVAQETGWIPDVGKLPVGVEASDRSVVVSHTMNYGNCLTPDSSAKVSGTNISILDSARGSITANCAPLTYSNYNTTIETAQGGIFGLTVTGAANTKSGEVVTEAYRVPVDTRERELIINGGFWGPRSATNWRRLWKDLPGGRAVAWTDYDQRPGVLDLSLAAGQTQCGIRQENLSLGSLRDVLPLPSQAIVSVNLKIESSSVRGAGVDGKTAPVILELSLADEGGQLHTVQRLYNIDHDGSSRDNANFERVPANQWVRRTIEVEKLGLPANLELRSITLRAAGGPSRAFVDGVGIIGIDNGELVTDSVANQNWGTPGAHLPDAWQPACIGCSGAGYASTFEDRTGVLLLGGQNSSARSRAYVARDLAPTDRLSVLVRMDHSGSSGMGAPLALDVRYGGEKKFTQTHYFNTAHDAVSAKRDDFTLIPEGQWTRYDLDLNSLTPQLDGVERVYRTSLAENTLIDVTRPASIDLTAPDLNGEVTPLDRLESAESAVLELSLRDDGELQAADLNGGGWSQEMVSSSCGHKDPFWGWCTRTDYKYVTYYYDHLDDGWVGFEGASTPRKFGSDSYNTQRFVESKFEAGGSIGKDYYREEYGFGGAWTQNYALSAAELAELKDGKLTINFGNELLTARNKWNTRAGGWLMAGWHSPNLYTDYIVTSARLRVKWKLKLPDARIESVAFRVPERSGTVARVDSVSLLPREVDMAISPAPIAGAASMKPTLRLALAKEAPEYTTAADCAAAFGDRAKLVDAAGNVQALAVTACSAFGVDLQPTELLQPLTAYTLRVEPGIALTRGAVTERSYTWSFKTRAQTKVVSMSPPNGAPWVVPGSPVCFDLDYRAASNPTISWFKLSPLPPGTFGPSPEGTTNLSADGKRVCLTPKGLVRDVQYTLSFSDKFLDGDGAPVAFGSLTFRTAPPNTVTHSPLATWDVPVNTDIALTFSMPPEWKNGAADLSQEIQVSEFDGYTMTGAVELIGQTLKYKPQYPLHYCATYSVVLSGGQASKLQAPSKEPLPSDSFTFTTTCNGIPADDFEGLESGGRTSKLLSGNTEWHTLPSGDRDDIPLGGLAPNKSYAVTILAENAVDAWLATPGTATRLIGYCSQRESRKACTVSFKTPDAIDPKDAYYVTVSSSRPVADYTIRLYQN
jgi:hypothetical protein